MADSGDTYRPRERSRSPRRRSRSPGRQARRRSYSPRSRSNSREDYRRGRDRSPMTGTGAPPAGGPGGGYGGQAPHRSYEERAAAREQMMTSIRETSQQDRRVYVGNLSYDVKWHHLKDFMRQAGEVLFADVLLLPNGMSKGCGIVEYATREQAQQAVAQLSNQNLMGRLVYVREDREAEPRFIGATGTNARGNFGGAGPGGGMPGSGFNPGAGGGGGGGGGGYGGSGGAPGGGGRQIYVANLPYNVGWQDLKDLFRQAARVGGVVRADVHMGPDGRPKGSGIVVFESPDDARNAIQQFNGYDWQGRLLEVREDRYAGAGGMGFGNRGGYGGGMRGGFGGGGGGGGGFGGRGGFGGGRGGYGFGGRGGGFGGGGGSGGGGSTGSAGFDAPVVSATIYVRNLPWSTSNDDLVELFTTIGKVEQAEIQYEPSGRSRGTGVVRFDSADTAETAIAKFQGYQYGGRPLNLSFVKYLNQAGNDTMDTDPHAGLTQDQIM
ncbi:putative RNA-binding protein [Cladobotryum mycophilum]|uniref:RNA-binding protein n=1 Tax=Cladobotryum mycophilum TaxID=491253 RepID=A0ABR0SVJ0_9HYPO